MASVGKALEQDEQYMKKFRRRQSDARWRANLASCYETLKLVIPLTTRATKKQISKVMTAQCYTKLSQVSLVCRFYANFVS